MAEKAALSIEQRLAAVLSPPPSAPEKAPEQPVQATQPAPERAEPEPALVAAEAPADAQEAAGEDISQWMPERLEEIAEAGGWDVADLYRIKVKVNGPDGKPAEVSLGEWKDAYQESAQLASIRRAEKEAHERAEAARKQALDDYTRRTSELQGIAQAAEQHLMARFNSINWDGLRMTDPAEWAAKRAEFGEEYSRLTGLKQRAMAAMQQQQEQFRSEQDREYQKYLREQDEALRRFIPELADAEKASKIKGELVDYMAAEGYSELEQKMVANSARLISLVRTDMRLKQADTAAKKVETSPKRFLKPGAAQPRASKEVEAYKAARTALRRNPNSTTAAAEVLKRFL